MTIQVQKLEEPWYPRYHISDDAYSMKFVVSSNFAAKADAARTREMLDGAAIFVEVKDKRYTHGDEGVFGAISKESARDLIFALILALQDADEIRS